MSPDASPSSTIDMRSLPDEIWHHVFVAFEDDLPLDKWWMYGSHLKHETVKTLVSLCLVSRQFHRVAQPLLYRTALLEGRRDEETAQSLFARTLAANPQLGLHTRTTSLDDDSRQRESVKDAVKASLGSLDLPPAFKRYLKTQLCFDASWARNALAAFHLAFMPQVQLVDCTQHSECSPLPWMLSGSLGMEDEILAKLKRNEDEDEDEDDDETPVEHMAKDTFANYGLPHLTEVRFRTSSSSDGTTAAWEIEPILLHPTLKRLRTLGIDWSGEAAKMLTWPDRVSNLQYLGLKECIVDAAGLRSILTRCGNLLGLSLETADCRREDYGGDEDSWDIDLAEFGRIIRDLGRNLHEFELHTLEYQAFHGTDGRLGSLKALASLRHLRVIQEDFLGSIPMYGDEEDDDDEDGPSLVFKEALPPSIETLYLHWDDRYYDKNYYQRRCGAVNNAVFNLLVQGEMPNLREVKVERDYNETKKEWDGREIPGWDVDVVEEHLWERSHSTGCMRTILVLQKK
ncbi:hypothetical protein ACJ41O_003808 [Fusarium nematophilum]